MVAGECRGVGDVQGVQGVQGVKGVKGVKGVQGVQGVQGLWKQADLSLGEACNLTLSSFE